MNLVVDESCKKRCKQSLLLPRTLFVGAVPRARARNARFPVATPKNKHASRSAKVDE